MEGTELDPGTSGDRWLNVKLNVLPRQPVLCFVQGAQVARNLTVEAAVVHLALAAGVAKGTSLICDRARWIDVEINPPHLNPNCLSASSRALRVDIRALSLVVRAFTRSS